MHDKLFINSTISSSHGVYPEIGDGWKGKGDNFFVWPHVFSNTHEVYWTSSLDYRSHLEVVKVIETGAADQYGSYGYDLQYDLQRPAL